jgi:hypothetical protein
MFTRRQVLACGAVAALSATRIGRSTTAEEATPTPKSLFYRNVPGVVTLARRTVEVAGLTAAVHANLTDATFRLLRFDNPMLANNGYRLLVNERQSPVSTDEAPLQIVSAPVITDQLTALVPVEGESGTAVTPQAALIMLNGLDLHMWDGFLLNSSVGWEDAPTDPTAPLMALLALAERTVAVVHPPPANALDALPSLANLPPGFVVVAESLVDRG